MPTPLELLEEQVKSGLIQGGVAASSRSEKIAAAGLQNVHPEAKAMTEHSRFDIASAIFHSGWTGQTICVDPENDFAAIVLTSRTGDWQEGYDGRNRIIEAMFQNKQE